MHIDLNKIQQEVLAATWLCSYSLEVAKSAPFAYPLRPGYIGWRELTERQFTIRFNWHRIHVTAEPGQDEWKHLLL